MKQACFSKPGGKLVTPIDFIRRATPEFKSKSILPYCPACDEVVHVYGVNNPHPDTVQRFDHQNQSINAHSLDDCVLAKRSKRLLGLEPSEWNLAAASEIRRQFLEADNLAKAYAFCLHLCRAGNLPVPKFKSMIQRADRKNIWAYADITVWVIPYILLLLEDFEARPKNKAPYGFHFILQKPKSQTISALWESREPFAISKVFANGGKTVTTDDNPYPISNDAFLEKAGDFQWILDAGFLTKLSPELRKFA